jgi:hypothetical protein
MIASTKIYSSNGQVFITELPDTVVQLYDSLRGFDSGTPEQELAVLYEWKTIGRQILNEQDLDDSIAFLRRIGFQYDFFMYHIYRMLDADVHRCGHCVHFRADVGGLCTKWRDYVGASYLMNDCFERRITRTQRP